LENARTTLAEQEAKVRDYEGKHEGELPDQQATNLQILSGLQAQLQSEEDALNSAKQQGVYYEALLEQYRSVSNATETVDGHPATLPAIEQQLTTLRAQLTNLSSHYSDRYPDVQNLKREIAKTEKIRDELVASLNEKEVNPKTAGESQKSSSPGVHPQDSASLQLQGQLQANHAEVANREKDIAELKTRINEYQVRLNNQPAAEQQLADLTRGYEQSKANFDELLKKKNDSEMATNMEQMQQGERFRMLDAPSLPVTPSFPNRLQFSGIGLGVGLALGLIVVGGFELLDDRMQSEEEIKEVVSVAVLSEVPEILTLSDEHSRKMRMMLGWATAVVVFGIIMAGSALSFFHFLHA
jgi:polysaccharide biosynthesis transport protein